MPTPSNEPNRSNPLPRIDGNPVPEEVAAVIVASRRFSLIRDVLAAIGLVGAIGTAAVFVSGVFVAPTPGATRSAALEWERQQSDAAEQIAQIEALRSANENGSTQLSRLSDAKESTADE